MAATTTMRMQLWRILCVILLIGVQYVTLINILCTQLIENSNFCTSKCDNVTTCDINVLYDGFHFCTDDCFNDIYRLKYRLSLRLIKRVSSTKFVMGLESVAIECSTGTVFDTNQQSSSKNRSYPPIEYSVKLGYLKMKFNYSIPVGVLKTRNNTQFNTSIVSGCSNEIDELKESCREFSESSKFIGIIKKPERGSIFPNWFLNESRYSTLGGHDVELHIDFGNSFIMNYEYVMSVLHNLRNCVHLRITGGWSEDIDASILRNTINYLRYLDLSNNKISHIHPSHGIFPQLPALEILIFAENRLKEMPYFIRNFPMLRHLDISKNYMFDIKTKGFEAIIELHYLKTLNIAFITIGSLVSLEKHFKNCGNKFQLEFLNMSHCEIQFLNNDDLKCQKQLRVIDLSYNKLRTIPSEFFQAQTNLSVLNLSNNLIYRGPKFIFNTNNLYSLDLSNNKLTSVDVITRGHVYFLNLSGNFISDWTSATLFDGYVSNLNLSHNFIAAVSKDMIKSLQILYSVDLGDNIFNCPDCTLPEFQNWMNETEGPKIYNLGTINKLNCSFPTTDRENYIVDIDFDSSLCYDHDYGLLVGVPVSVIVVVVVFTTTLCYHMYRFEITYIMHLINAKRNKVKRTKGKYTYDVFVSYSGNDRAWVVGNLLPTLESEPEKYQLCLHERDFVLGSFIVDNIITSIESSRHTIVVLTDNFVKSQWCLWELELANHKLFEESTDFLILIELERLDRTSLPRHLKYLMDTRTYLEWPENKDNCERAWRRLKEALGPSIHSTSSAIKEEEVQLQNKSDL